MDEYDYCADLLKKRQADFWDVRQEDVKSMQMRAWNGELKDCTTSLRKSISVRVLKDGALGFSYSDSLDNESLKETVSMAVKMAETLSKHAAEKKEFWTGKPITANVQSKYRIHPDNISLEEKKQLLLDQTITAKNLDNQQYQYTENLKKTVYSNSEGSTIKQQLNYTHLSASITQKHPTLPRVETFDTRQAALAGFELTAKLPDIVKEAFEGVSILLKAKTIKGGMMPVVTDPALTDVFVHEAVGHAAEADIVMQKDSFLEGAMGKKIAPDNVTVVDSGMGSHWGCFFYDDEGIPSQETEIIKNGIVNSYLHNRETAAHFKTVPTGNGRAQDAKRIPQVRMRWTYVRPGTETKEELIEQVKEGVFLVGSRGGQVSTSKGTFQFSAQHGFKIKNGKLGEPVREVSLGGIAQNILSSIKGVSKDMPGIFPGHCGKGGQLVPVGGPCPFVLIGRAMVGGKSK